MSLLISSVIATLDLFFMSLSISSVISLSNSFFVVIVIVFAFLCFIGPRPWRSNSLPYPPGPPGDPFIGNIRQISAPDSDLEQKFEKWGKQYGDVNFMKIFHQPLVVINSFAAARDLLEKRGAIYSSRPRMVLIAEMMSWGEVLVYQETGPRFRKHRQFIQEQFSSRSLVKFRSLQRQEVYTMLSDLGSTPEHVSDHIKRFAASMILNISYGYVVHSHHDPLVTIADEALSKTVSVPPAAMLVDFFPILKYWPAWMPFSGWKKHAMDTRILVQQMFDIPYTYVKTRFANGTASPCIATDLFEIISSQSESNSQSEDLDNSDVRDITAVLYAAATETTASLASSFILLMVLNPEVFKKVQEEIDQKIGTDRLLDFDDRESLPYFECVLKEVFRWTCPVPLGVPHRLIEDDVYNNQFIPKDSTVMANAWAILRNENVYPEPHKFDPERFVGKMDSEAAHQVDSIFGFGRRVCPGKAFADATLWLLMSNVIAMFTVDKALDDSGEPITPSGDFSSGFVRCPKEFPSKITYRSEKAKFLVAQAKLLHN